MMSGDSQETIDGILVRTKECEQLGVFVYVGRIAKKVVIKFYTIYLPGRIAIEIQKQQVLSMHKQLSPMVNMWEESLKYTTLVTIQQSLNIAVENTQKGPISNQKEKIDDPIEF